MAVFDRLLVFQSEIPASGALNMAIDEALLEWSSSLPAIRFYHWARPSISFGYFGRFQDVAEFEATHDLVRRWTGGGIVFHGNDLTYSLAVPISDPARPRMSEEIYREVHKALRDALNQFDLGADIVTHRPAAGSNACFDSPVVADVMIADRKVAGAAHRQTKTGLLHQGSIQNVDLRPDLSQLFAIKLSGRRETMALPDSIMERASTISATKYGTLDWLKRR
jgi:lipoate-protein ligase A